MSKQTKQPIIQSLNTGLKLIEELVNANRPLKFSEIEELTKMTKSSLHKYLNTLTLNGILFRDETGTYYLGSKLIEFGNAAIGHVDLINVSAPYLRNISNKVGLTTLLSVWSTHEPVIANISRSNLAINIGASIGTKLPPLSSAGKIYLAFQDSATIQGWKDKGLKALSSDEKSKLEKEISEVKNEHFSYAAEPLVEHISSFSVPILNFDEVLVGVITVVGFTKQIPKEADNHISELVKEEVRKLSHIFGYQSN